MDLPLHHEREAGRSLKTGPEKQACSRTVNNLMATNMRDTEDISAERNPASVTKLWSYLEELTDKDGDMKFVKALGLDSIAGKLLTISYRRLKSELNPQDQEQWTSLVSRPPKIVVELLVGSEYVDWHPVHPKTQRNAAAKWSRFKVQYVLDGTSFEIVILTWRLSKK